MARYNPNRDVEPVLAAARVWIESCLISETSLFGDHDLWNRATLQQVVEAFIEQPDIGDDAFLVKLERQLRSAPSGAIRLMAELLWVLMLFQSNIRPEKKRETLSTVWGWSGTALDHAHPLLQDSVLAGVGNTGTAYNTLRWRELNYLIGLAIDLAGKAEGERRDILRGRSRFERWIGSAPQQGERPFRQVFRYLAFPDDNERITQRRDRRLILDAYGEASPDAIARMDDAQQDDALNQLRARLQRETGQMDIDFYVEPFVAKWRAIKMPEVASVSGSSAFDLGFDVLRGAFLSRFPDFEDFGTYRPYLQQERIYKDELRELFSQMVMAPLARDDWPLAGESFLALLLRPLVQDDGKPQNIVGWRYIDLIKQLGDGGRAGFVQALSALLDESTSIEPRVDAFIARWKEIADGQKILAAAQRSIVGFCLSLAHPDRHVFLKTQEMRRALQVLDPSFNWSPGQLTGSDVARVDALAAQVFERLAQEGWAPADLIDAQGFLWVAVNQRNSTRVEEGEATEDDDGDGAMQDQEDRMERPPLNRILYGPPGTGKTYHTIDAALEVLDPEFLRTHANSGVTGRRQLKARFDTLMNEGLVRFVTFHQSFSYEDFVEGLRADRTEDGMLRFLVEPGVFRQICEAAGVAAQVASEVGIRDGARIWKISIDGTGHSATRDYGFQNGEARIGWGEVGDLDSEHLSESAAYQALGSNDRNTLNAFAHDIQPGDVLLCISSASEVQAVGVVQGDYRFEARVPAKVRSDYNNVLPVRWLANGLRLNLRALNGNVRFTLKTVYELTRFSWAELADTMEAAGIQLEGVVRARVPAPRDHVLIIDEINRGNVSRIFGELITLIEPSKRAGMQEQLKVMLPYSKKTFQVPSNLYLIGTMNTADRSLATLDIALRRRFSFVEMPPKPELLSNITIGGVNLEKLLSVMNDRIEALLDRDHAIGHALFMSLQEGDPLERLAAVFRNQIIPLLREYFFEDWERIAWVLNDHRKPLEDHRFLQSRTLGDSLFGSHAEGVPERKLWSFNDKAFNFAESFAGIIEVRKA